MDFSLKRGSIIMPVQIADIMKFFGSLTEFLFLFSVFNFVEKGINKKYRKKIQASKFKVVFNTLMKFTVKNHKLMGLAAILFGTIHGLYELNASGYNMSLNYILAGVVTLSCLLILGILGVYGYKFKKAKRGNWFYAHRVIAGLAIVGLLLHLTQ